MGKIQIAIMSVAAVALLGCGSGREDRAAASSGGGTVAAARPAEEPMASPPVQPAQTDRAQRTEDFRQGQRK